MQSHIEPSQGIEPRLRRSERPVMTDIRRGYKVPEDRIERPSRGSKPPIFAIVLLG